MDDQQRPLRDEQPERILKETKPCDSEDCLRFHNETGHHYGCECVDCMQEYWMLKH